MMTFYHQPVLQKEAIEYLNIKPGGVYVDATLGGSGHTQAMLKVDSSISVYAFDQDEKAIQNAKNLQSKYSENLHLIQSNFKDFWTHLALHRVKKIDGILFDLGVSSHQIDQPERGFSFMVDGELDMRMNCKQDLTAYDVVNNFTEEQMQDIFWSFGEEREAKRIAKGIIAERKKHFIKTTLELAEIISKNTLGHQKLKAKARIFQAIRIYINQEMEVLQSALKDSLRVLNPKGRLVVISYHSLEDRIVKHFMREEEKNCTCPESFLRCICDKVSTIKVLTKKPILPTESEIKENKRARSAKMRVAEKRDV